MTAEVITFDEAMELPEGNLFVQWRCHPDSTISVGPRQVGFSKRDLRRAVVKLHRHEDTTAFATQAALITHVGNEYGMGAWYGNTWSAAEYFTVNPYSSCGGDID